MSGYVAMSRDWQGHKIFGDDQFSRRDAWAWLIAEAAWKPKTVTVGRRKVQVGRGELSHSVRFLADKWGWSKSAVSRFLNKLQKEKMVEIRAVQSGTVGGTVGGTDGGTVQSVITICNYDKFQAVPNEQRDSSWDAQRDSQRDKEEPKKPVKPEERSNRASAAAEYEFEGRVIRLTPEDFQRWKKAFPDLPLLAKLQQRDDWLATEADDKLRRKWFIPTSNWLANEQQKASAEQRAPAWDGMP